VYPPPNAPPPHLSQRPSAKVVPSLWFQLPHNPSNQSYFHKGQIAWRVHVPASAKLTRVQTRQCLQRRQQTH
jgi:hypothetical protein